MVGGGTLVGPDMGFFHSSDGKLLEGFEQEKIGLFLKSTLAALWASQLVQW